MLDNARSVDVRQADLVDTYARSTYEGTRRKSAKYSAMGCALRATKRR